MGVLARAPTVVVVTCQDLVTLHRVSRVDH
jgi:hypothetical protein